mmetsp:Transcript_42184/g.47952  ORF Transcript_42184/g.47952 Transcript_42184/m.47952 type:complete len:168 (-) Transcript_42184:31-534(-)
MVEIKPKKIHLLDTITKQKNGSVSVTPYIMELPSEGRKRRDSIKENEDYISQLLDEECASITNGIGNDTAEEETNNTTTKKHVSMFDMTLGGFSTRDLFLRESSVLSIFNENNPIKVQREKNIYHENGILFIILLITFVLVGLILIYLVFIQKKFITVEMITNSGSL